MVRGQYLNSLNDPVRAIAWAVIAQAVDDLRGPDLVESLDALLWFGSESFERMGYSLLIGDRDVFELLHTALNAESRAAQTFENRRKRNGRRN